MNSVNLTGRITREPEVQYTNSGTACLSFNVAVDKMPDAQGNKQTNFIPCVAWGNTAKFIGDYVKKGNMLSVSGEIQTRSYTDKDNNKKIVVEVLALRVECLTPRENPQPASASNPQVQQPRPQPQPQPYQPYTQPPQYQPPQSFNGTENDLPW